MWSVGEYGPLEGTVEVSSMVTSKGFGGVDDAYCKKNKCTVCAYSSRRLIVNEIGHEESSGRGFVMLWCCCNIVFCQSERASSCTSRCTRVGIVSSRTAWPRQWSCSSRYYRLKHNRVRQFS